ncbi:MAG: gliding motility-associated C-terminal domain-containing protein [Chitinophagales bacterium]
MKHFLLCLSLFLFVRLDVLASHLLGADINYECLGPGQYRVTLQLYRDCNGIVPSSSQTLTYSSSTCGVSGSIQLSSLGSPVDITPLCPNVQSACGGNGSYGVQEWVYQGILNLPPGCGNDWILGWSQCCRNGAINTLSGPSSQDMYVGVNLDNTITPICNSSPTFNNSPGSIVCVNQPVVYNHGVSDVDGDSLYFSLGTCYQAQNTSVNYGGGFNGTSPLTTASGVSINPNTGAISFTPTTQQVGVLCVNVREYRNGVLIGQVNRDMQFTVIACSNVPPQASGVDGTPNTNPVNFETSICANGTLCFTINGSDPNSNNVTMSWNNEIPGGVFTVTNNGTTAPVAQFCWNPGPSDIGQNVFTVNVEDDACPIIGQGTYTYIIDVLPSPNILDAGPTDTICFGESTVLTATSIPAALSYTWSPASSLSSSTGASVTASPLNSTNYVVSATFPDGCDLTDVVNVLVAQNPSLSVSPSNSFNCSGQANNLVATGFSNTGGSLTYNWTPGNFSGPNLTVSPTVTSTYTVTATDGIGCQTSATATVTIAAPTGNVCNVLYVTPTGSPNGTGSRTSPMDLITALEVGACNGTTVKMAVGDYITDTVINRVTSYITLEGGFDPTLNWDKISTAGATRILRTATQSYSLVSNSIVLGSGIINESGPNPEVVAMRVSNQTGFRFQDLTIETELNSPGTTMAGYQGPDIIGVRLNSCDNYNIVRTRIIADNGGAGANQIWSILATSGGDSRALEINTNGAGGNIINSSILAGTAGAGGTGTPNGANGVANNITLTGTALSTNNNNFNLTAQPVIRMNDIACTETLIDFSQTSSGAWTFGTGSAPASANGALVTTQYSSLGRKNINYGANVYTGFANILLDAQVLPAFTLSAPFIQGQYRVCAGSNVDFSATNGGVGYTYHWDMDGGASPNNYDGTGPNFQNINGVTFPTSGIYSIMLQFETNCCGLSIPTFIDLYVEEAPDVVATPSDAVLCYGSSVPININVEDNIGFGQASWSPAAGLDDINGFNVNALPGDTTLYVVTVTDSTGLCSDINEVLISVVNLELSTSVTNTTCGPDGTATVVVSGGSGNYAYQWDDPSAQTTATASNLAVGVYNVYVTDIDLGCIDSASVVINPGPGTLVGFLSNVVPVSCLGNADGTATVSIVGGQAPFDYIWSPAGGSSLGTTSTSNTSSLLPGGNYEVFISDANECEYTVNAFIPEPDSLILEVDTLINPTCVGATNGSITLFADGGNAPLIVVWDDPANQVGITASNLGVGTYCAVVTDDNGCSDSMCFTLTAPLLTTIVDTTVCYGTIYTYPNGASSSAVANNTQIDTLITAIGCDSIVTTNLTVVPEKLSTIDTTICIGQSIVVGGTSFSSTLIGGVVVIPNNGPQNCDSTVTINLIVQDFVVENLDTTLCQGQTLSVNGVTYTDAGFYQDTAFYSVTGCDSIQYVINLAIDSFVVENIDTTLCQGQTLSVNGVTYTDAGFYQDTAFYSASGCDSIQYVINLAIDSFVVENIDTTLCQGQTLSVNGVTYTNAGFYQDTAFYSVSGCDSIQYVINLAIDSFIIENIDTTICQGQTLSVNGVTYTDAGFYQDTAFYSESGCDSIQYVINLAIDSFEVVNIDTILCFGESLTVNGVVYSASGFYQDTLKYPVSACDQIQYNIDLLILDEKLGLVDTAICDGESIFVNGNEYNSPTQGAIEVFVVGPQQCDSTVTINLEILALPTLSANANPDTIYLGGNSELVAQGTGSFEWDAFVDDSVYIVNPLETTSYSVLLTDSNGCVSETSVTVFVIGVTAEQIIIPDAFTPNGDGLNDVFRVVTEEYFEDIEMIIYNRWGDILHRENGPSNHGWDGTYKGELQANDSYIYVVRVLTLDGNEFYLSGNVALFK